MKLNDPFHQCQTDAGSFCTSIELMEESKNIITKFLRNPNSVILNVKDRPIIQNAALTDLDPRLGLVPMNLAALSIRFCITSRIRLKGIAWRLEDPTGGASKISHCTRANCILSSLTPVMAVHVRKH